jgi:uncharacterized protein (DUF58 family)
MSYLVYLVVIFVLLAIVLRVDFVFYVVYVIAGIFAWSRWLPRHHLRHILVDRSYDDHAFLGEPVTVTIRLQNRTRFRVPWFQFDESIPLGLRVEGNEPQRALTIKGRESVAFSYEVQAYRRGYYRLGPLKTKFGDLFGFTGEEAEFPPTYLTVYPRITPVTRLGLPARMPFGTVASNRRLFEDPARPMGVRPYRSGDSLRQVNWKVSARQESLLVKTLEPAISLESCVLLNLNASDYGSKSRYYATEWAVEIAASIAAHLIDRRQAVGLATNGADPLLATGSSDGELVFDKESGRLQMRTEIPQDTEWKLGHPVGPAAHLMPPSIPTRGGRAHLMKVLELLARIESDETVHFPSWIPSATVGLSWGVTVLVITPLGNLEVCQALHRLVQAGYNPVLLLVERRVPLGQVRERARRLGFSAYELTDRGDFEILGAAGRGSARS